MVHDIHTWLVAQATINWFVHKVPAMILKTAAQIVFINNSTSNKLVISLGALRHFKRVVNSEFYSPPKTNTFLYRSVILITPLSL